MELTHRLRHKLSNEHLMFAYRGQVTDENSVLLLTLLEREMEFSEFSHQGRKRLFMFVLENLQNITRHGTAQAHDVTSLVVYSKTGDGYTVMTGNALKKDDVTDLRENLEKINSLEPDQIREVYRNMLQDSSIGHKGGAGLGLIEMARKTGNRLDYDFFPIDSDISYFILSKTVDAGGKGIHQPGAVKEFNSQRVMLLEKMMKKNNIYFIWAGPLTHDIGKELLHFSEATMHEAELEHNLHKRVFAALIELLQNVAQHSPGFRAEQQHGIPVAMIRKTSRAYVITSGNLIRNDDISLLQQKLDMINRYDEEGLRTLLRTALMGQDMRQSSTGYMGLLEMARRSGNKLEYTFEKVSEDFSYYILTVRVRIRSPKARK